MLNAAGLSNMSGIEVQASWQGYIHCNFCVVDFYVTMFSVLFGFILMERLMNISIEKSSVVY